MSSSRKDSFTLQALQITDALLVWLAFILAGWLRAPILDLLSIEGQGSEGIQAMVWVLYIAVPFTPLVLERFGFYKRLRSKKSREAAWQLVQGIVVISLIISLYSVFAKVEGTRRLVLALGSGFIFINLFLRARLTSLIFSRQQHRGRSGERVVIAGSDEEIDELLQGLDADAIAEWDVIARFDLALKSSDDLYNLLKKESVSRVVFAAKSTQFEKVARSVEVCELQGVEAWIAASFIQTQIARPVFDSVGNKPMLVLRSTPELSWELLCKELMDRIGAFAALILTSPIWIIAAIGVRIASPGAPVFFSQMRAGKYGKPFRMWKLRTMVADAEERLKMIKEEHGNQMDGPVFKLEKDPRIFPFGALLRRLSIDELPQFFNVFLGDMSLVGPRPLPMYEVEAFSDISHRRRLSVKPGITCEWQAGGRSQITSFEQWVEMDLKYIDNWSLWLDFTILLRTVPAVLFGKGAK